MRITKGTAETTDTITPNGSVFSHRSWISFFLFFPFAQSFQNFSGCHYMVLLYTLYVYLRDTTKEIIC
jgi:hypothetical protein